MKEEPNDTSDTEIEDIAEWTPPKSKKLKPRISTYYVPSEIVERGTPANFDEIRHALQVLAAPNKTIKSTDYCGLRDVDGTTGTGNYSHLKVNHIPRFIKRAILRRDRRTIAALLKVYIDERKQERYHTGLILDYLLAYFMSEPVAIENGHLRKFLETGLSLHAREERIVFLRKLLLTDPPRVKKTLKVKEEKLC